jgi:predicted  nucleic acid-binding Zn-ribbon protein
VKTEEINALLELQSLDLKLIEYEEHQKVLPQRIEEIESPLRAARAAREKVEAELEVAKSHQRTVEAELVANNDNFKKLQTKQMAVRNQIELEAFQHELDALKDRADVLEETGLRWLEAADAAAAQLPDLVEAAEAAEKTATELRAKLDEKTAELKRIHDEASKLQAPFLDQVPHQVLAYYKRLRSTGKTPFAAVIRKSACSGCGFQHPPQKLQEIKKARRMMTCEQCGRIQIWREEEEEKIGF